MAIIFLIGMRGTGKTTVGKALAKNLDCEFIDLDEYLQKKEAATVGEIVAGHGWEGFRKKEAEALRNVVNDCQSKPSAVVATGGGAPLLEENRELMRASGHVCYLRVSPGELARRLRANPESGQRPSLTGKDMIEELAEVYAARRDAYRDCAHVEIDAEGDPEDISATALLAFSRYDREVLRF